MSAITPPRRERRPWNLPNGPEARGVVTRGAEAPPTMSPAPARGGTSTVSPVALAAALTSAAYHAWNTGAFTPAGREAGRRPLGEEAGVT